MECKCKEIVRFSIDEARSRARSVENDFQERLDSFRNGITEGSIEIVSRYLFRAGVYLASLQNNLEKDPTEAQILRALSERLQYQDELRLFLSNNLTRIEFQIESTEPRSLLSRILRRRKHAAGLLEANVKREISQAVNTLVRIRQLEQHLKSWGDIRLPTRVESIVIVDMHDS